MTCHLLIDAHNMLYRCAHTTGHLTLEDGTPCGAAYGFMRTLLVAYRAELGSTGGHVHVVWDGGRSTRRLEILPDYKRKPRPQGVVEDEELREQKRQEREDIMRQRDMLMHLLGCLGVHQYLGPKVEADDIISVLAHSLAEDARHVVAILSGDDDFRQLVRKNVVLVKPGGERLYDTDVQRPREAMTLKCLTGCKSDNIPGLPKVGDSSASQFMEWCRVELAAQGQLEPAQILPLAGRQATNDPQNVQTPKGRVKTALNAFRQNPEIPVRNQGLVDLDRVLKWPEVWDAALTPLFPNNKPSLQNYTREMRVLSWPSMAAMLPEAEAMASREAVR